VKYKKEIRMKASLIIASALLLTGSALALHGAPAQQPEIKRTNLQRNDLSVPGREVIQVRVDIPAGVTAARHSHPGEEIVYVIDGSLEYSLDGKPPAILKTGEVLFIPNGAIHSVKNLGSGNAAELATYIVEKGKPLVVEAK
jgi:quercetin dioxygenase-like cupin family protein